MKKLICLFMAIIGICSIALTGCGNKSDINANTRPGDIRSSIITEKEWREGCSFIGMRDKAYEVINGIEYPIMKKMSATMRFTSAVDNMEAVINYNFTAIQKEHMAWACKVKIDEYYEGQHVSGEKEIGQRDTLLDVRKSYAYYELDEWMDHVIDEFSDFTYDEQKGGYCKMVIEQSGMEHEYTREIILKFKGNRLVCYQDITPEDETSIIFYDYN